MHMVCMDWTKDLKWHCIKNHASANKDCIIKTKINYITTTYTSCGIARTSYANFLGLLVSHFMTKLCVPFYFMYLQVIISEAMKLYNTYCMASCTVPFAKYSNTTVSNTNLISILILILKLIFCYS